jgi:hypothetical protein
MNKGKQVEAEGGMDVDVEEVDADPMADMDVDAEEVDADPMADMDGGVEEGGQLARVASRQEKEEIAAFGSRVAEESEALAKKWKRQRRDVLIQAGLGSRLSRGPNTYNEFMSWYASTHEKDAKSKPLSSSHIYCPYLFLHSSVT